MQGYLLYFFPSSCFEPGGEDSPPNLHMQFIQGTAASLVNLHCSREAFDFTKQKGLRAKKGVSEEVMPR